MIKINKTYKYIHDQIHGYIPLSNLCMKFVNSYQFQRLKKLSQLGVCSYVFPNATHTRFEHSLGTYFLAGKLLDCIISTSSKEDILSYLKNIKDLKHYFQDKEYLLDDYLCELIKIAALCHDIGHGPFSHLFDDMIVSTLDHRNKLHEQRSELIVYDIIKSNEELSKIINEHEIIFMQNLINPKSNNTGFLYQIVSNYLNGLDVDKYDYITRDSYMLGLKTGFDFSRLVDGIKIIDNIICYPESSIFEIVRMYYARYCLHKQVYSHKSVIAIQYLVLEIIKNLDPIIAIKESIYDMNKFYKMTDEYILNSVNFIEEFIIVDEKYKDNLNKAIYNLKLLNTHTIYPLIRTMISNKEINLTIDDIHKINNYDQKYDKDIIIFNNKIGFVSGNKKNPLKNLYSFSSKIQNVKNKINIKSISLLIPSEYQEYITFIFFKNETDFDGINNLRKIFSNL
jgi:HD superfamily phosphohydrolase